MANSNLLWTLLIFAVVAILVFMPNAEKNSLQSALSVDHEVNNLGDIILPPGATLTTFSFVSGYDGYVDDNRVAGCIKSDGSQIVRYFGDLGWSSYGSCQGWMAENGCDTWSLQNGATCSGSSSDSSVECQYDSECAETEYCTSSGSCSGATCSSGYKCESGTVYHCVSGNWGYSGSCYDISGGTSCLEQTSETFTDLCERPTLICYGQCDTKGGYEVQNIIGGTSCPSGYATHAPVCETTTLSDEVTSSNGTITTTSYVGGVVVNQSTNGTVTAGTGSGYIAPPQTWDVKLKIFYNDNKTAVWVVGIVLLVLLFVNRQKIIQYFNKPRRK